MNHAVTAAEWWNATLSHTTTNVVSLALWPITIGLASISMTVPKKRKFMVLLHNKYLSTWLLIEQTYYLNILITELFDTFSIPFERYFDVHFFHPNFILLKHSGNCCSADGGHIGKGCVLCPEFPSTSWHCSRWPYQQARCLGHLWKFGLFLLQVPTYASYIYSTAI